MIDEILLKRFGYCFGFRFFGIDLGHEIGCHHIEIILKFFISRKLFLKVFELNIKIAFDGHITGADSIKLGFEGVDSGDILIGWSIGKRTTKK